MHPIVALLASGGTISTTINRRTGGSQVTLGATDLLQRAKLSGITVVSRELERVPSWTLDPVAMSKIALAARDAAHEPGVAGVVVTHGTTTLEYSAFLADLVLDGPSPVVFTGAMRRADDPDTDGGRNLRDAILVAASPAARGLGALVVFAGHVIAGRRVWKAHRTDVDAFVGLDGFLGRIIDGRVEIARTKGLKRSGPTFSGRLETRVAYVKAVPGMDGRLVEAAIAEGARGLVVEGLPGVGGVPEAMSAAVVRAAARIPVVLASRAPYGRLPEIPTGGTGEPLRDSSLLSAGDLTAEQAWLLLMAARGEGGTESEIRRRFDTVASSSVAQR